MSDVLVLVLLLTVVTRVEPRAGQETGGPPPAGIPLVLYLDSSSRGGGANQSYP